MFLRGLGISGYRSYGSDFVYFNDFGRMNIISGQNNSGKSNLLRVISRVLPSVMAGTQTELLSREDAPQLSPLSPMRIALTGPHWVVRSEC